MSLINQMLRDLERRQGAAASEDPTAGLRAAATTDRKRLPPALLAAVALTALAAMGWRLLSPATDEPAASARAMVAPAADRRAPVPRAAAAPAQPPAPAPGAPTRTTPAGPIAHDTPADTGPRRFLASAAPTLRLAPSARGFLREARRLDAGRPPAPTPPPMETAASGTGISIAPRPQGPELRAQRLHRRALEDLRAGRAGPAAERLVQALSLDPGNLAARATLARLHLGRGRPGEAEAVLARGLALAPRSPELAAAYARLLVARGELERARAALLAAQPGPDDAECHALLATIAQRRGEHQAAHDAFRRALAAQPRQGAWWVGLAISLEALERPGEARAAYRRALRDRALGDELSGYAAQRTAALE